MGINTFRYIVILKNNPQTRHKKGTARMIRLLHQKKRRNTPEGINEGVSQNESRYPLCRICRLMKHILAIKAYISLATK